jgi:hypothetical protein
MTENERIRPSCSHKMITVGANKTGWELQFFHRHDLPGQLMGNTDTIASNYDHDSHESAENRRLWNVTDSQQYFVSDSEAISYPVEAI